MAFLSKVGNILRQTVNRQINCEVRSASVFASLRCMSTNTSPKLFVGGLSYNTDEGSLTREFAKYGNIVEAKIIHDRETGRSRGFGFVTFNSAEEAASASQALDGKDLDGRQVRVSFATERPPRTYGGGYGGGGGGFSGGGGGYGNAQYGGGGYGDRPYGGAGGGGGGGGYGDRDGFGSGAGGGYGDSGAYGGGAGGGFGGGSNPGGNYGGPSGRGNYQGGGIDSSYASSGGSFGTVGSSDALGNASGFGIDSSGGNYRDDDNDADEFAKRA